MTPYMQVDAGIVILVLGAFFTLQAWTLTNVVALSVSVRELKVRLLQIAKHVGHDIEEA